MRVVAVFVQELGEVRVIRAAVFFEQRRAGLRNRNFEERVLVTEAFAARTGNCIGFANMMIALARAAGLDAHYQEVSLQPEWSDYEDDTVLLFNHVNVVVESPSISWVVDVSGLKIRSTETRRIIGDN
ncbi:MAG: transglutaminase domain-containing protein, partial [Verrucomicrobiota bacterium]